MNDEKIIELFCRRDEQAIRESMIAYGTYCHKVASGILTDPADAEEAVADTWLAAWDAIPTHKPQCLRLFLGRITRNKALSLWRKHAAQSRGGGQPDLVLEELGECIAGGSGPEQIVDTKELGRAVNAFLKNEPVRRRNVFLRRYFYMEDLPDIAKRYGLTESNVRMMLSRTRQRLKKYLQQEGYL